LFRKKIFLSTTSLFLVFLLLMLFSMTAWAGEKKRIAVTDFENDSQVNDAHMGRGIADMLVVELVKNKAYQVVERAKLQSVLKEQGLGATGAVDASTAAKLGKLLGLDYLVVGKIVEAGAQTTGIFGINETRIRVILAVRLIDATTGNILLAESAEGEVKKGSLSDESGKIIAGDQAFTSAVFSEAARKSVIKVVDKLNEVNPLEGYVIQVDGKKIYIDLGREQGVQVGQKYTLFKEGKVIKHPVTGKIMGVERNEMGTIKIVSVEKEMAIGEAEDGTITSILKPGDKVKKKN